jgi:hypothetical protein
MLFTRRNLLASGLTTIAGLSANACAADDGKESNANTIDRKTFTGTYPGDTSGTRTEGITAANGMHIVGCSFHHLRTGIRISESVSHLSIEQCEGDNLYRLLDDTAGHGIADASLRDFVIRNVRADHLGHGLLRLRYQSTQGLIEDVTATCSEEGGSLYCVGFALDGQASQITYRRAAAHGFRETGRPAGKYWNGDGFTDERQNSGIRYIDCLATDCTDGGFDCKSAAVMLEHCVSRGNKRNYRLWSSGELHNCESHDPVWRGGSGGKAHFSFHGDVDTYRLIRPVVRAASGNDAPVFLFHTSTPARVLIEDADIDAPSAPMIKVEAGPPPMIEFMPPRSRQRIRTAS